MRVKEVFPRSRTHALNVGVSGSVPETSRYPNNIRSNPTINTKLEVGPTFSTVGHDMETRKMKLRYINSERGNLGFPLSPVREKVHLCFHHLQFQFMLSFLKASWADGVTFSSSPHPRK